LWITLLKSCGKVAHFFVDGHPGIVLITYEYSCRERYGRNDDGAGNSAAQLCNDTPKLIYVNVLRYFFYALHFFIGVMVNGITVYLETVLI
jgi:hypothetical protein